MKYIHKILCSFLCILLIPALSQAEGWGHADNRPELVLGSKEPIIRNIYRMDQPKLQNATLSTIPWTSDYWATANGGIAHRYAQMQEHFLQVWERCAPLIITRNTMASRLLNSTL